MFQRSFFYEVGVCLIDSGTEHVSSSIQKLQIVQIGRTVSKLFCNPFHSIYVRILISKSGFAGNFCSHPRNAMILADSSVMYWSLQCSAGHSSAREKRTEKVRCDECKMTIPILRSIGTQRWFMRLEGVQYLARK